MRNTDWIIWNEDDGIVGSYPTLSPCRCRLDTDSLKRVPHFGYQHTDDSGRTYYVTRIDMVPEYFISD